MPRPQFDPEGDAYLPRPWALVLALLLVLGCSPPPRPLSWTIDFAPPGLRTRTAVVRTEIREGGCAGPARYSSDARPGMPGEVPPRLPRGRWGFAAEAFTDACVRIASDCQAIDLPGPTSVTTTLRPVTEAPACEASECSAGSCARPDAGTDARIDAGVPVDARDGGRDAFCPDAPRDGGAPLRPTLPCGSTYVTERSILDALEVTSGTLTPIADYYHRDGICGSGCREPVIRLSAGTVLTTRISMVSEVSLLAARETGGGSFSMTVCGMPYVGPISVNGSGDPGLNNLPAEGTAPIATMGECDLTISVTGGTLTIRRFDVACHPSSGPVVNVSIDGMPSRTLPAPANAVLSWSATGATSCDGSGAWSGPQHMTGSIPLLDLCAGRYSYALSCNYRGGTAVIDIAELTVE